MFKKTLKRLGAIVMVLAMAMSVMMVSAFASTQEVSTTVDITKKISKEANVYLPNANFVFTITPMTEKYTGNDNDNPAGGIYFEDATGNKVNTATISSTPGGIGETLSTIGTATLHVDLSKFSQPGVYQYTLTEAAGYYESNIGWEAQSKTVYVSIIRTASGLAFNGFTFKNNDTTGAKNDATFINDYSSNHGSQKNYKVIKVVGGAMGDTSKAFNFTVTITGPQGKEYNIVKTDQDGNTTTEDNTFTLKHNEFVTIYGISTNDTVSVVEDSYESAGYSTTQAVETDATTGDKTETFTNTKDTTTPTGVIMNIAPYVLMVALAGGIAFFFLRRRHAE